MFGEIGKPIKAVLIAKMMTPETILRITNSMDKIMDIAFKDLKTITFNFGDKLTCLKGALKVFCPDNGFEVELSSLSEIGRRREILFHEGAIAEFKRRASFRERAGITVRPNVEMSKFGGFTGR